jgi:hypothetical protein
MSTRDKVAFIEDCDDEDSGSFVEGLEGTRRYALSEAPASPTKELPNTSKSREHRPATRRGGSSGSNSSTPSAEREAHIIRREKSSRRERDSEREERRKREERRIKAEERAAKESSRAMKKPPRPTSLKQSYTQPLVQQTSSRRIEADDPRFYGVQQPAMSGERPRGYDRPQTYYAGQTSRPPITNMGWHQNRVPGPFPVGTFPPPQMYPNMPPPGRHAGPPPGAPSIAPSYFDQVPPQHPPHPPHPPQYATDLRQRFDRKPSDRRQSISRPTSSMGMRGPADYDYDEPVSPRAHRTPRSKKQEDDRRAMPPPSRPQTTHPSTPFRPPPQRPLSRQGGRPRAQSQNRRSVGFVDRQGYTDDDFGGEDALFHDISPEPVYNRQRSNSRRGSLVYEHDGYEIIPARTRSRRSSTYGSRALGGGGVSLESDSKYLDALRYQDDVNGGPQLPLTAESLRKASKRGEGVASSRSTRSSGSRDESEYKRSSTTGITRSSSGGNDDVTIKVAGSAMVRVQGAEIEWEDGGEITFTQRNGSSRYDSEKASTIYQLEDSQSRFDPRKALPLRSRAPSQADSYSRGYTPGGYAPYDPMLNNYI